MKTLVVDDDFTARVLLQETLKGYGPVHVAVDGKEAVDAARVARDDGEPYDLICLDIMMPEMDGKTALKLMRAEEEAKGVKWSDRMKIVMTTAVHDLKSVTESYKSLADAYITKPIDRADLLDSLRNLELIT